MSRLQKLVPTLRRVGLSATISDPDAYRSWLAPDADMDLVDLVMGDPGAEPEQVEPAGRAGGVDEQPQLRRPPGQRRKNLPGLTVDRRGDGVDWKDHRRANAAIQLTTDN